MNSSSDSCASCGHSINSHTDRAIFPPCEADVEPRSIGFMERLTVALEKACFCKAFQSE